MEGQSTRIADAATATEEIPYSFAGSGEGKPYLFAAAYTRLATAGGLHGSRAARDPTAATGSSDGSILYIAEAGALAHNDTSFESQPDRAAGTSRANRSAPRRYGTKTSCSTPTSSIRHS
jgi:hypothetical protein